MLICIFDAVIATLFSAFVLLLVIEFEFRLVNSILWFVNIVKTEFLFPYKPNYERLEDLQIVQLLPIDLCIYLPNRNFGSLDGLRIQLAHLTNFLFALVYLLFSHCFHSVAIYQEDPLIHLEVFDVERRKKFHELDSFNCQVYVVFCCVEVCLTFVRRGVLVMFYFEYAYELIQ